MKSKDYANKHSMKDIYMSFNDKINIRLRMFDIVDIDEKFNLLLNAYLPGIYILNEQPKKIHFTIEFKESKKVDIVIKNKEILFNTPIFDEIPIDIFHLLYSVLRNLLIVDDKYIVHGACIESKNGNSLIIGHSKSGKTSILLKMLNNEIKIFSSNKSVIDFTNGLKVIAGTTSITIGNKYQKKDQIDENFNYLDRKAFFLNPKSYSVNKSLKINKIFLIKITEGYDDIEKLNHISALHQLYPYFLDCVNADTILDSGDYVYNGNITSENKTYLSKNLKKSLNNIQVYSLSGSKEFIKDKILNL